MTVRYITVTSISKLFKPATRSFGDIAIVGAADTDATGPMKTPVPITNPDSLTYSAKTSLANQVNETGTSLSVSPLTKGFPSAPFSIKIDNEVLRVIAVNATTNTWTVERRQAGTTATSLAMNADADATVTSLTVSRSTTGFPSVPFNIKIDDEVLKVTAVNANTWTVERGQSSTTAATHNKNAPVTHMSSHDSGTAVTYATKDKAVDDAVWFKGDLARAVRTAFAQTPGPVLVWAVRVNPADANDRWRNALDEVAKLDVQIVTLANTPLVSSTVGRTEIELLAKHVDTVSNTGGDGKERIGVAMLDNGASHPDEVKTGTMSIDRMVLVAHKSTEDAAAAVAGTIAGYEPHISLLLKQVSLGMDQLFSDTEIDAFNTARVNWLTDPSLLPGKGLFMGEGYTLGTNMPYIDIVRTIDDISFRLKAQLIRSIGALRITRAGLRTLASQMTAVLEPLKQREVIDSYVVFLPLLVLLDKDPASLTDVELQQSRNARANRTVDAIITVEYAGAIHRLNISLIFQ